MSLAETFALLHQRLLKYDLLSHPFYKAWSAGDLQREELREYAQDYYHHVEAFPIVSQRVCDAVRRRASAPGGNRKHARGARLPTLGQASKIPCRIVARFCGGNGGKPRPPRPRTGG